MNLRKGLTRLAVALSVVYWGTTAVFSIEAVQRSYAASAAEAANPPAKLPWETYWPVFKIKVPDGRVVTVRAQDHAAAENAAAQLVRDYPRNWQTWRALDAFWETFSPALFAYGVMAALWFGVGWIIGGFHSPRAA